MIKSKSVFEFRGRHEVLDADGAVIGMLEKDFTRSLLRSHWHVRDAAGVRVALDDGRAVAAPLLVGAEGRNSPTREAANIPVAAGAFTGSGAASVSASDSRARCPAGVRK